MGQPPPRSPAAPPITSHCSTRLLFPQRARAISVAGARTVSQEARTARAMTPAMPARCSHPRRPAADSCATPEVPHLALSLRLGRRLRPTCRRILCMCCWVGFALTASVLQTLGFNTLNSPMLFAAAKAPEREKRDRAKTATACTTCQCHHINTPSALHRQCPASEMMPARSYRRPVGKMNIAFCAELPRPNPPHRL